MEASSIKVNKAVLIKITRHMGLSVVPGLKLNCLGEVDCNGIVSMYTS